MNIDAGKFFIDEKKNLVFLYKPIMKQKIFKRLIEKSPTFTTEFLKTVFKFEEAHGLTVIKQLHKIFKNRRNQDSKAIREMFETYKHCLFASLDFYLRKNVFFIFELIKVGRRCEILQRHLHGKIKRYCQQRLEIMHFH